MSDKPCPECGNYGATALHLKLAAAIARIAPLVEALESIRDGGCKPECPCCAQVSKEADAALSRAKGQKP